MSGRFPSRYFITARIRRMEAYVFSLSTTWGGGVVEVPQSQVLSKVSGTRSSLRGTPVLARRVSQDGYPWPGQDWGIPSARTGLGYPSPPLPARTGLWYSHPPRQNSRMSTCYAAGAMPRAVSRRRTFLFVVYFFTIDPSAYGPRHQGCNVISSWNWHLPTWLIKEPRPHLLQTHWPLLHLFNTSI